MLYKNRNESYPRHPDEHLSTNLIIRKYQKAVGAFGAKTLFYTLPSSEDGVALRYARGTVRGLLNLVNHEPVIDNESTKPSRSKMVAFGLAATAAVATMGAVAEEAKVAIDDAFMTAAEYFLDVDQPEQRDTTPDVHVDPGFYDTSDPAFTYLYPDAISSEGK